VNAQTTDVRFDTQHAALVQIGGRQIRPTPNTDAEKFKPRSLLPRFLSVKQHS